MKIFAQIDDLQLALEKVSHKSSIAFVPTMGNLHQGHLALVKEAKRRADVVVASIFVNPLQFGANEDLDKYPRTLEQDEEKLRTEGVDILFTPNSQTIYPQGLAQHSRVSVPELSRHHCGASRPGHFDGVTTVVNILFNIIQPDMAIFGEKDFQQLAIIRKMVSDLYMPIEILAVATGRAADGLALSSRNQYLSTEQRAAAPSLYQSLQHAREQVLSGQHSHADICQEAISSLEKVGFEIDYFNISDASTLDAASINSDNLVILAAAKLGTTRLIDNVSFSLKSKNI
jgi:pantoate--beta-alanine ligase